MKLTIVLFTMKTDSTNIEGLLTYISLFIAILKACTIQKHGHTTYLVKKPGEQDWQFFAPCMGS